jgi:predicted metalloprotease with PDZ domain
MLKTLVLAAYAVHVHGKSLDVDVRLDTPLGASALVIGEGAAPFVAELRATLDGKSTPVRRDGQGWRADACRTKPCRLSYRFDLAGAASALDDTERIADRRGLFITSPTFWLVRVAAWDGTPRVASLKVAADDAVAVASGLPRLAGDAAYALDGRFADHWPTTLLGPLRGEVLRDTEPQKVDVRIAPRPYKASDTEILAWARRGAKAVVAYFGRFPVDDALIFVRPAHGGGMSLGYGGAVVLIPLDYATTAAQLADDWVMTHEMVHLALPSVRASHHWLEEGLATYVEPIARLRSGELQPESVWADLVKGLPQGLPAAGDGGLDVTHTWGRTYWGGALFWFAADVEIRKQSRGKLGLEDALKGVIAAGGSIAERWEIDRLLETADQAVGLTVLRTLYGRWKNTPATLDLAATWRELGVAVKDGAASFDDAAPSAYVRRGITRGGEALAP